MEREGPRNFSIEPYVEGGGIMGNEIEVDQKAASSIMRRTALRRDVLVSKGYFREVREFEGDEEIAISTARVRNARQDVEVSRSGYSTLVKNQNVWQIQIHDQQVGDSVNEWMEKHYNREKQGLPQEVFSERFTQELRGEVVSSIRSAFLNEKRNIAITSSLEVLTRVSFWSGVSWIIYKGSEAFLYALSPEKSIDNSIDLWTSFSVGAGGLILGGYISALCENLAKNYGDKEIIHAKEKFLPNFTIPSTIAGSISLILSSGKLIRLNKQV